MAHAAGLTVTPWTFRSSSTGTFGSVREEMARFLYEYDVDAVFTDNPESVSGTEPVPGTPMLTMSRDTMMARLAGHAGSWDVVVVGGGATGRRGR